MTSPWIANALAARKAKRDYDHVYRVQFMASLLEYETDAKAAAVLRRMIDDADPRVRDIVKRLAEEIAEQRQIWNTVCDGGGGVPAMCFRRNRRR